MNTLVASAVLLASLVAPLHASNRRAGGPVGPQGPKSIALPAAPLTVDAAKAALAPALPPSAVAASAPKVPSIHALANGGTPQPTASPAQPKAKANGRKHKGAGEANAQPQADAAATPTLTELGKTIDSGVEDDIAASAAQAFDGAGAPADNDRVVPRFEPPTNKAPAPEDQDRDDEKKAGEEKRLTVSFQAPQIGGLIAVEPQKAIYGTLKRVRDFPGSRDYWKKFKKGVEIDVVSRGESVFGRPTKIKEAFTTTIGQLTRDDLKGLLPEFQLGAPIRELRKLYVDQLETARKTWNPNDPEVTLATTVRVVKFQSYLELFQETHGAGSMPEPEQVQPRTPLSVKAEGVLEPLTRMLPRAVFLDLDAIDGRISKELLSDMMKLQRTGVYFVAFSRKPYAEDLREKLVRQMSAYQLSILMPIRFMAVTDNGAVISGFPKGGNVVPVSVDELTPSLLDVLRDTANQVSIDAGVSPYSVKELAQAPIKEKVEEFAGRERSRNAPKGQQVRFELLIPKSMTAETLSQWRASFEKRLAAQGLKLKTQLVVDADGRRLFQVQKTDLRGAMPRLMEALGEQFGLYLNPSDILVLSDDPAIKEANPNLDFAGLTKLKGSEMIENALGLLLGDHRENHEGDLSGSASRIAQFTRDRTRYMSEFLVKQDGQEQNIHFFSGHAVHSSQDWLVYQLQNGKRPTIDEYEAELRRRWDAGIREFKAVGIPQGHDMEGWERESVARGRNMYKQVLAIHDRGEILIGTEIPNFFMLKDYTKRTEELKRRYTLHTIFDFIALRPDPKKPGHATVVVYDFKTGPAQSRQKLNKDVQVLTYALFAKLKWVGKTFQTPYMTGSQAYTIDAAKVEFIYGAIKQPTTITDWDLEFIRKKIISTLNRIRASEEKLMAGPAAKRAAARKAAERKKKAAAKKRAASRKK